MTATGVMFDVALKGTRRCDACQLMTSEHELRDARHCTAADIQRGRRCFLSPPPPGTEQADKFSCATEEAH